MYARRKTKGERGRERRERSRKDGGKEIGRSGSGERSREERRTERGGGVKRRGSGSGDREGE